MLKRALPKEFLQKMKNKKFPLRGPFWDRNFRKISNFCFCPQMVGNMLKRALRNRIVINFRLLYSGRPLSFLGSYPKYEMISIKVDLYIFMSTVIL